MDGPAEPGGRDALLLRTGRRAWAVLGVVGVLVLVYLVGREVSVVATPLAIALFPAAVLWPLAAWLKGRGLPATLVALFLVLSLFGLVALVLWFIVPRFADELPTLADSVEQAISDLSEFVADTPFAFPFDVGDGGLADLADEAFQAMGQGTDVVGQGLQVARTLTDVATATVLFVIALFFYLRDGERIWAAVSGLLPDTAGRHVRRVSGQLFWTLGAYFRGQMVVALADAVFIGIGLAILGVPLVLPLALLIFFGGFFPIVGAFVSGLVAVLVALADQGLTTALIALLVVVVVQQAEGNLLEPLILSPVLRLHPFVIILAVTVGAVTYGVLGAFLAVPLTACAGRIIDYARGRPPAAGPAADGKDGWGGAASPDGATDGAGQGARDGRPGGSTSADADLPG
ncbi:AI-2E family transporter [Blastococcus tunisiensis]|uniref:Predicted PurR-regulated permease PerM n=1 Tax=Blastococcus tunisiensis TaxID=1798228 RepID=A0A1I2GKE2_9ACTN|nr:AI-2E family transporter [Blastococcus sp. DSM 46838]SFF17297.1 Predicted PurR-regulated permease PerM [Blastococcus sp. DSM 46838]